MDNDTVKKVANLLEKTETSKKPVRDIQTSILQKITSEAGNDIKKEYFKTLKECSIIKTGMIHCLNKIKNNEQLKKDGEQILTDLTKALKERIETLKPTIQKDGQTSKFRFRDGSESVFENYKQVEETVMENMLLNRINTLENIYSEALGFVTKIETELWHREDGIEEIDVTKGYEETKERTSDVHIPVSQFEKKSSLVNDKKKSIEEEMDEVINNGRNRRTEI